MKIAVVVTDCVQVGPDSWHDKSMAKVFDSSTQIDTILAWAKAEMKWEEITLDALQFAQVVEDKTP